MGRDREVKNSKYRCSTCPLVFRLLRVESRDFSQAEKERTACKPKQIHKMTTTFTQSGPRNIPHNLHPDN